MNRLAKIGAASLKFGVKARTIWLAYLAGIATGCLLMLAWVYTLAFATSQAVALLAWVQA
jgi:hypothetical protein